MNYPRPVPPNKSVKGKVAGKATTTPKTAPKLGPPLSGNMKIVVTVNDVTITIEGPVAKVVAVLRWIFGTPGPEIASLQLLFGPEVKIS